MASKFCKLLKANLKDEKSASRDYADLIAVAPSNIKSVLRNIRKDESRHAKTLERYYKALC